MSFQAPVADKGDLDTNAASPASTTACVLGPLVRTSTIPINGAVTELKASRQTPRPTPDYARSETTSRSTNRDRALLLAPHLPRSCSNCACTNIADAWP
jgi:hypothetical protein